MFQNQQSRVVLNGRADVLFMGKWNGWQEWDLHPVSFQTNGWGREWGGIDWCVHTARWFIQSAKLPLHLSSTLCVVEATEGKQGVRGWGLSEEMKRMLPSRWLAHWDQVWNLGFAVKDLKMDVFETQFCFRSRWLAAWYQDCFYSKVINLLSAIPYFSDVFLWIWKSLGSWLCFLWLGFIISS